MPPASTKPFISPRSESRNAGRLPRSSLSDAAPDLPTNSKCMPSSSERTSLVEIPEGVSWPSGSRWSGRSPSNRGRQYSLLPLIDYRWIRFPWASLCKWLSAECIELGILQTSFWEFAVPSFRWATIARRAAGKHPPNRQRRKVVNQGFPHLSPASRGSFHFPNNPSSAT